MAKHLCSNATDLAVQCVQRMQDDGGAEGVQGVVLSPCCHHQIEWGGYCNVEWLEVSMPCLGAIKASLCLTVMLHAGAWVHCS